MFKKKHRRPIGFILRSESKTMKVVKHLNFKKFSKKLLLSIEQLYIGSYIVIKQKQR